MTALKNFLKWLLFFAAAVWLVGAVFYFYYKPSVNPVWGINFSPRQAQYLGFDPKDLYSKILTELQPKKIRLTAYWEDIEPQQGQYAFEATDALLGLSQQHGTKVILVLGLKQPRWPECHKPSWYNNLDAQAQRNALLSMVEQAARHFGKYSAIERWQIENEPFFNYGPDCPTTDLASLRQEVAALKTIDLRPVVVTDSGEKGWWFNAARVANIFGTTVYRKVYNSKWHAYQTYLLPAAYYRARAGMIKAFNGLQTIDVELQAEPWFIDTVYSMSLNDQLKLMDINQFNSNISYAEKTGLPEHYFWGVEWWYWMKTKQNHPEFWDRARQLMSQN